jgi:ElaB/YqjD/DUF883 family membrane-anchored ribosome-binding protein
MAWQSSGIERSDLERLLHEFEARLARVTRGATRMRADAPRAVEGVGEAIASALNDLADRIRGRSRHLGTEVSQFGDDALRFGNEAVRRLTREAEQRPLVTLAVAVGVGALIVGLLARRD